MYNYSSTGAPWYRYRRTIKSIILENGITGIGEYTFAGIGTYGNPVPELNIPEGVRYIANNALRTANIAKIIIPASVINIEHYGLAYDYALETIQIDSNNKYYKVVDGVLFSKDGTVLIKYPNEAERISYTIPAGVTEIGICAFDNSELEKVVFNNDLKKIESDAFYYCRFLTEINLPESLEYIGASAFAETGAERERVFNDDGTYSYTYTYFINSVTIPKNVSYIGARAFGSLKEVKVSVSNPYFNAVDGVLMSNKKELIYYPPRKTDTYYAIPRNIEIVQSDAFRNNTYIEEVSMLDAVELINSRVFMNCTNLKSVDIPRTVDKFGGDVFTGCTALEQVYYEGTESQWNNDVDTHSDPRDANENAEMIFADVTSGTCGSNISWQIDDNCTLTISGTGKINIANKGSSTRAPWNDVADEIENVVIGEGVTSIPYRAFHRLKNLETISIPSTVDIIEDNAFMRLEKLSEIKLAQGNTHFKLASGVLYSSDDKTLIRYPSLKDGESYTIPDGVEKISGAAFECCNTLKSIDIPDSAVIIGEAAFSRCSSLENIVIPQTVTKIEPSVFEHDTSLTSIAWPKSITTVSDYSFYGCTSLANVTIPDEITEIGRSSFYNCTALTGITLPQNLEYIGMHAFNMSKLENVTFPKNLRYIDEYAFRENAMTNLVLPDSLEGMGSCAFTRCYNLESVKLGRKINKINDYTFYDCEELTDLYAPQTVELVDESAFYYCRNLEVTYEGSKQSFENIDTTLYNEYFERANVTYVDPPAAGTPVEVIGKYKNKISIYKETDTENNRLIFTVRSLTNETLPNLNLYAVKYDGDTLSDVKADVNEHDDEGYMTRVLIISQTQTGNYKILLWDNKCTPLIDVIEK